jgi:hypothetical protein
VAVKTYYMASGQDGNFGALVDGVAQTAASRADGWTVAKIASANASDFDAATKQVSGTFAAATGRPSALITNTLANAFKTPTALNGAFANTAWTFTFAVRATVVNAQLGRIRMRVYRSVNADGSGATEITGATQVGTTSALLSTTADVTTVVTWSPGAVINLANEFLFFTIAWEITTAGGSNTADCVLRTGSTGPAGSRLVTPDFVPAQVVSIGRKSSATTVRGITLAATGAAVVVIGRVGASVTSVGPAYDSTVTQTGAQTAWSALNEASTANSTYSSVSLGLGGVSNDLVFDNFGLTIPAGVTVNDIKVELFLFANVADVSVTVWHLATPMTPQNFTAPTIVPPGPTVLSGLWGHSTWTQADISSLEIRVQASNLAAGTVLVDYLCVTVSYTVPAGAVVRGVTLPTVLNPPVGRVTSATSVKGMTVAGSGVIGLTIGQRAATTTVRGITLAPLPVTVVIGRCASATTVYGLQLVPPGQVVPIGYVGSFGSYGTGGYGDDPYGGVQVWGITPINTVGPVIIPITLTATMTLTPAMARTAAFAKTISVTTTLTPAFVKIAKFLRAPAATTTITPVMTRAVRDFRLLAVTVPLTSALSRFVQVYRTISGSVILTPVLARKLSIQRTLAASTVITPLLVKFSGPSRVFNAGLNLAPALSRRLSAYRTFAASTILTPTLTPRIAVGRLLAASTTILASMTNPVRKLRSVTGAVVLTPSLSLLSGKGRILNATTSLVVGMKRTIGKGFPVNLNFIPKIQRKSTMTLAAQMMLNPALSLRSRFLRVFDMVITLSALLSRVTGKRITLAAQVPLTANMLVSRVWKVFLSVAANFTALLEYLYTHARKPIEVLFGSRPSDAQLLAVSVAEETTLHAASVDTEISTLLSAGNGEIPELEGAGTEVPGLRSVT